MSVYIFQLDTNKDQANIDTSYVIDHQQHIDRQLIHIEELLIKIDIDNILISNSLVCFFFIFCKCNFCLLSISFLLIYY